jgi:hypothetical protein
LLILILLIITFGGDYAACWISAILFTCASEMADSHGFRGSFQKYVYIKNSGIANEIHAPLHRLFCHLSLIHDDLRIRYSNGYLFINVFQTYLNAIIN